MLNTTYQLPTGQLSLQIDHSDLAPEELFGVGARCNPKRAFLFVSKVLAKHYPVDTQTLDNIYDRLAAKLPPPEGKVSVFIGMAETATALAQGVFEAWLARYPNAKALYVQTSRLQVRGQPLCVFEESHSHASRQLLHLPTEATLQKRFEQAERLILIDDELSTGRTFVQLHQALQKVLPQKLEQHWLCVTDFCRTETPTIARHSLLQGQWQFQAYPEHAWENQAPVAQSALAPMIADSGSGRTGIAQAIQIAPEQLTYYATRHQDGERILVLGTGEYMYPPVVFARELARRSQAQVWVQSSTRSPALVWNILQHKRPFADPYDEGVPYYLYNLPDPRAYQQVYICHEHPANHALQTCAHALGAELVHLQLASAGK